MNVTSLEPGSPLPYLFDVPGNVAFLLVYGLLCIMHSIRFCLYRRHKKNTNVISSPHKWSLTLPIAEAFMTAGFALRLICRSNQQSIALYATANLFVILSPTAFIAFVYMMYGRLIVAMDPMISQTPKAKDRSELSPLPPKLVGRLFIASDISTFIVQASGGGLQAIGGSSVNTGNRLFLIGVTLQAVSYGLFCLVVSISHFRVTRHVEPFTCRSIVASDRKISRMFFVLYIVSLCILIRSVFRIAEMAGGYTGSLYRTEKYLFSLDALPLAIANLSWAIWWPPSVMHQIACEERGPDIMLYHRERFA